MDLECYTLEVSSAGLSSGGVAVNFVSASVAGFSPVIAVIFRLLARGVLLLISFAYHVFYQFLFNILFSHHFFCNLLTFSGFCLLFSDFYFSRISFFFFTLGMHAFF